MPLKVGKSKIEADPALNRSDPDARGDRKVGVTELWPEGEKLAGDVDWRPPEKGERAPVMQLEGVEFAFFTEAATQTRHRHEIAHEIYTILEGRCVIEVVGEQHLLEAGDSLIVVPGECHEVLGSEDGFLAQVVVTSAAGIVDKFECEPVLASRAR